MTATMIPLDAFVDTGPTDTGPTDIGLTDTQRTDTERTPPPTDLSVIGRAEIEQVITSDRAGCTAIVEEAYRRHHAGASSLPHSTFLRFPDRPRDRVIALPAHLAGDRPITGIKWISSFPGNTANGVPRASAVLLLNDMDTGFPHAVLESSVISAARTAASAVLSAGLCRPFHVADTVTFIGAGHIATTILEFLLDSDWLIGEIVVHDLVPAAAERFAERAAELAPQLAVRCTADASAAVAAGDVVFLATVAGTPWIDDPGVLRSGQVLLHVSLRDLGPRMILAAANVTDDVDHAVREQTSLHLTEQLVGHRTFIDGTIGHLLEGSLALDASRPVVVSAFGLGVLDLAVGTWVLDRVHQHGHGTTVPGFFSTQEHS